MDRCEQLDISNKKPLRLLRAARVLLLLAREEFNNLGECEIVDDAEDLTDVQCGDISRRFHKAAWLLFHRTHRTLSTPRWWC